MLILSRRPQERLSFTVFGFKFSVVFVRFQNGKARLGIEGPPFVRVLRSELDVAPVDDEAALVITGSPAFVAECKALVDRVERAGQSAAVLAVGLELAEATE